MGPDGAPVSPPHDLALALRGASASSGDEG